MIPKEATGTGQGRGNSGVELMTRYEIQVLESNENLTYADGAAGAMYGIWPPLVNPARPQGEWNVYDIMFEAPRFEDGKLLKPAYFTVLFNGVLVQNHQEQSGHHHLAAGRQIHPPRRRRALEPAGSLPAGPLPQYLDPPPVTAATVGGRVFAVVGQAFRLPRPLAGAPIRAATVRGSGLRPLTPFPSVPPASSESVRKR